MAKKTKSASNFDAGLLGYIGISLLALLLIVVTLTIGTPWVLCMLYRWQARHTTIDGARLYFDGTGWQLIGTWIKWLFFTVITVGIFALWLPLRQQNWITKHTHHEVYEA